MQIKLQKICKNLGESYYNAIVECFGEEILLENKELNRKKLAGVIFSDKEKKREIDNLTFKFVVPRIRNMVEDAMKKTDVVIDAALLFEMGVDEICDITIGVVSSLANCIDRICKRDGITEDDAMHRISSQKDVDYFKINCTYVACNNYEGELEENLKRIFKRKRFIK